MTRARSSLSKAEDLLDLASAMGADVSATKRDLAYARKALRSGQLGKAAYGIKKSSTALLDAVTSEFDTRYGALIERIERTSRAGADTGQATHELRSSRRKMKEGRVREAVMGLRDSERRVKDLQTELVLRILYDHKGKFAMASKAALDINPAVFLVNESRRKLKQGDVEAAIASARKGTAYIDSILGTHEKARSMLIMCNRAVGAVESIGVDTGRAKERLEEIRKMFQARDHAACIQGARDLIAEMKRGAHGKASQAIGLSERAFELARDAGVVVDESEDFIAMARDALGKEEFAKSIELSNMGMFKANSALAALLEGRARRMDQFARGVAGELSNISEIEKAISTSRDRSLESVRRYSQMTEQLVGQAYDSAVSYARVTQDMVKEACRDFLAPNEGTRTGLVGGGEAAIVNGDLPAVASVKAEDQRLRIVDLYLSGRISELELGKLLTMLDSSAGRGELVR